MPKKMTREGRLRKPHRREWPGFLRRLVPDPTWRELQRLAKKGMDPRTRWSPKLIVLCWLMMGWSIQGQLTERFREGRETLSRMFYRRRRCGESYQGLTQATQRAGVDVFRRFWEHLRASVPQRVGSAWRWYGWTVFAVDGSRIDAPRTRRNEKALGKAARDKSHPQWWITRLIHLPTKMMWDWRQGPGNSSERAHLREMIPSLPKRSLLVGDIGFGGFDLLGQLSKEKVAFVIRCGGNSTLLVENTRQEIERKGDVRWVYLWPKNCRRKKPLRLRLIVLKDHGKRVYLLTNVKDTQRLSRRMAGEFYRARWGIEVEYRGLKQTLGHRKVLARTPEPGAMELAADILPWPCCCCTPHWCWARRWNDSVWPRLCGPFVGRWKPCDTANRVRNCCAGCAKRSSTNTNAIRRNVLAIGRTRKTNVRPVRRNCAGRPEPKTLESKGFS